MFRTALRNVLAHKTRLLMTVLAVMLGVAFAAGTMVFTNTISDAYQKSSSKGFDRVDVAVTPGGVSSSDAPGKDPKLTEKLRSSAEKAPGAASATGVVQGFTAVADKHGKLIGGGFSSKGGNYWGDKDPRYPLRDGHAPKGAGEVAIDARTADRAGYHVGDHVRMSVDGPVMTPTISGIFSTDDGNVAAGGNLTLFDTATAQKLFHEEGRYDEIDVKAAAGTSQVQLQDALDQALPKDAVHTKTGQELADRQAESIASSMSSMKTGLLAFAGIALFVGIFIIANTFSMLVAQRTKELALLRAVGASRRQVTRSVLLEALVVGVVAAITGLLAGIGIGAGMKSLVSSLDSATVPDGPLVVSPGTIATALAVGIVVTVLSAWLPGRRAAKIPPVAAMSSVHATPTTRSLVLRNTLGSLIAAAGAVLVVAGTQMHGDDGQPWVGAGAAVLVIGIFVLTPLLSRPLIAAAAPLLNVFGVSGKLARQNSVRNPRRTAATASALMIGLCLITGMTVIAGSAQQAIDKMAVSSLKADYVVSMANFNSLAPDVAERIAHTDGVTASSPMSNAPALVDGERHYLTGVNGHDIGRLTDLDVTDGSFEVSGRNIVVDDQTASEQHWKAGQNVRATFEDGKAVPLTVAGVYHGNDMIQGILMDNATMRPHQSDPTDMQVLVKAAHGPQAATKDAIQHALGDNPGILVQDKQSVSGQIAKAFTLMLNMLYGLLAMAVIIAVLGVINTLAMSVFERSQEIGMLRAIGLDRPAVKRMVRLESVVISLFGGVLGVALGVFFGWAAGKLIASHIDTYALVLPWGRMAIFLVLAGAVGVLAAMWPARRAARLNMLNAIHAE
ncbi:ABC transporter permease [Streptomyces sp. TS71-3]|uniref:ABC transporter permease n=1 Tax=Streptomyces sp. TS71-3 TaxID=2733862 RepID=UPI001B28D19B|nr:FtsX-like permease family protein [Streptomyces sp. TS71-3]GHJ39608.1 ABC transporter [Streptomyces sp. TS71-3]